MRTRLMLPPGVVEGAHTDRRHQPDQQDADKTDHHRQQPRDRMPRNQITVADGQARYERKLDAIAMRPAFQLADHEAGRHHGADQHE